MEMIKQLPHRAAQVEDLELCATIFEGTFNKRTLLNIFPNVRVLRVEWNNGPLKDPHNYIYFNEPIEVTHSNSKITVLRDAMYCELASQMLTPNLCGKLEELKLDFAEITGISTDTVLGQLRNLPALKKLELQELCIGVKEIETIHQNLPTIREFILNLTQVIASEMPSNVTPTTLISDFNIHINNAVNVETHIQFYQYMLKKYSNVENIEYYDEAILCHSENGRKRAYLNGILDFYKLVNLNKKELCIIGVPDDIDIFEVLDSRDCRFEELSMYWCGGGTCFDYLAQSNQSRYIQKLTMSNMVVESPNILKNMTALTTLELNSYSDDGFELVFLTAYLNACPATLKRFSITCSELRVSPAIVHFSPIETLDISCEELTRNLADTISTCFPKLVHLSITVEYLDDDVNIALQNHSLESAYFYIKRGMYGFVIKTPSQLEHTLYVCTGESKQLETDPTYSISPTLTFTSFTGKELDPSCRGFMIISD